MLLHLDRARHACFSRWLRARDFIGISLLIYMVVTSLTLFAVRVMTDVPVAFVLLIVGPFIPWVGVMLKVMECGRPFRRPPCFPGEP